MGTGLSLTTAMTNTSYKDNRLHLLEAKACSATKVQYTASEETSLWWVGKQIEGINIVNSSQMQDNTQAKGVEHMGRGDREE